MIVYLVGAETEVSNGVTDTLLTTPLEAVMESPELADSKSLPLSRSRNPMEPLSLVLGGATRLVRVSVQERLV